MITVQMSTDKGNTMFSADDFAFGAGGVEFATQRSNRSINHTFIPYHAFNRMSWEEESDGT